MANVVTSKGREFCSGLLRAVGTEPKIVGWGLNPATITATVSDVAPFKEAAEARVTGVSSQVTTTTAADTYQVVATLTSASGQTIAEVSLSDATTKPFSTTWTSVPTTTSGTAGTTAASFTPANNTYVQTRGEVMQVTAGSGSTSLTVVRGVNGSTAVTLTNGDTVTAGNPATGTGTSVQATNANQFFHADFAGLALLTGDSIQFTLQVKFT